MAFTVAGFTFDLVARDSIVLPTYKGSALRGGFGYAFRKVACVLRRQKCNGCILRETCIYSYVFETPPPKDTIMMRKYPRAPHPFVIMPPLEAQNEFHQGDSLSFSLVLIGKAIQYLPYFIYSFLALGEMGLGRRKGKFSLSEVRQHLPPSECALFTGEGGTLNKEHKVIHWDDLVLSRGKPVDSLTIRFLTPTRIRYQGRYTDQLEFHILIRSLLRRISSLSYFHCGQVLEEDFRGLIEAAQGVTAERKSLKWVDWERYSTRQATRMKMGGFLGTVTFRGNMEPFWPYLVMGELVHVGKGTSFGLGKYEVLG